MANGPYRYRAGPDRLGIGVDNMALERPPIASDFSTYGPRYNVRGDFAPFRGAAQFPLAPLVPNVGLRANGVYLSGDMALQALTDFNKANKLT
jgi:hypothetical protein